MQKQGKKVAPVLTGKDLGNARRKNRIAAVLGGFPDGHRYGL